jgi:hypothetical protein
MKRRSVASWTPRSLFISTDRYETFVVKRRSGLEIEMHWIVRQEKFTRYRKTNAEWKRGEIENDR